MDNGKYWMTFSLVKVTAGTGQFRWLCAGAPKVAITRSSGQLEMVLNPGNPLGNSERSYGEYIGQLHAGDRLLVLTDGFNELAISADGKCLSSRAFRASLQSTQALPILKAHEKLLDDIERLRQGTPLADDITCVLVEIVAPDRTPDKQESV